MPHIHSVMCTFPRNYYKQEELIEFFQEKWKDKFFNSKRIEEFHRNVLVGGRHLAVKLEEYKSLHGFGARNEAWIRVALDVAERAVLQLLEQTHVRPQDISLIATSTVTGVAVPSLEARLMNKIPFRSETKRLPIFGLGCLAGAAGINRVVDYLKGHPKEAAIFLSVELCSLTAQFDDFSVANLVSTGLFGDGGAAVLLVGDEHPLAESARIEVTKTRSVFFPHTERVMGWDMVDTGFKIVLSNEVPNMVIKEMPAAVDSLLEHSGVTLEELGFYVAHPGGPKVLEAMEKVLNLNNQELKSSWDCLMTHGNMSSVSVLFVLEKTLAEPPKQNSNGLMMAMGPAFCSELSLLKYRKQGD